MNRNLQQEKALQVSRIYGHLTPIIEQIQRKIAIPRVVHASKQVMGPARQLESVRLEDASDARADFLQVV